MDYLFAAAVIAVIIIPIVGITVVLGVWLGSIADTVQSDDSDSDVYR